MQTRVYTFENSDVGLHVLRIQTWVYTFENADEALQRILFILTTVFWFHLVMGRCCCCCCVSAIGEDVAILLIPEPILFGFNFPPTSCFLTLSITLPLALVIGIIGNRAGIGSYRDIKESCWNEEYTGISSMAPGAFMLSFLIIFGNMTTLLAIKRMPSLQTKSNAYVASLACADIMVGLVLIPYGLWLIPDIRNRFDQTVTMCNLIMSAGSSAIVVSILNLLLVALERLVYISYPFFYQRVISNKVIGASIALPWLIGLTFGNSQWFINVPKTNPPQCVANKILPTYYYKYVANLMYFIPCGAIFIVYIRIILIARKHSLAIKKMNSIHPFPDKKTAWGVNPKPAKMNDKNWKAAKMMMTVFGLFFTCWTPRFILHTIPDDYLNNRVPEIVYNSFMMLGLLNSGINFLVYPFHNMEFRKALIYLLCVWSRLQKHSLSILRVSPIRTVKEASKV
ncbi:hypothetical protein Btru_072147 [Bulinus truncatus]|nr:hypothetical protein Btru_072147 [Bulinus truncatus]